MSISLDQQPEMLLNLFLLYLQVKVYQNILKLRCWPHALTIYDQKKLKTKRGLELVFLPYFLHDFWTKIFIKLCSINWSNFTAWLALLLKVLGNMHIVINCLAVCNVKNPEINFSSLIKTFYFKTKKSGQKIS